ncbi:MAG: DUF3098 domain-containing protein [Chitinophagales bacterium]
MEKYEHQFLFNKKNFSVVLIGLALMVVGFCAMVYFPPEDKMIYDEETLYGFRTTVLAPMLVLAGLLVQIVAIFLPTKTDEATEI